MLRIGICDDAAEARLSLRAMVERLLEKRAVEYQVYEFSSGEGLLGWMEKHTGEVDLVFLDIEMGGMNGMEAAKALRAQSDTLQLVFVTGYTDLCVRRLCGRRAGLCDEAAAGRADRGRAHPRACGAV